MQWIADPGHAWLKVKISRLFKAGVANKISGFSYIRGQYAYLEEDCDAWTFLQAIGHDGKGIKGTHTNRDSRVRSYQSYNPMQAIFNDDTQGILSGWKQVEV